MGNSLSHHAAGIERQLKGAKASFSCSARERGATKVLLLHVMQKSNQMGAYFMVMYVFFSFYKNMYLYGSSFGYISSIGLCRSRVFGHPNFLMVRAAVFFVV